MRRYLLGMPWYPLPLVMLDQAVANCCNAGAFCTYDHLHVKHLIIVCAQLGRIMGVVPQMSAASRAATVQ